MFCFQFEDNIHQNTHQIEKIDVVYKVSGIILTISTKTIFQSKQKAQSGYSNPILKHQLLIDFFHSSTLNLVKKAILQPANQPTVHPPFNFRIILIIPN